MSMRIWNVTDLHMSKTMGHASNTTLIASSSGTGGGHSWSLPLVRVLLYDLYAVRPRELRSRVVCRARRIRSQSGDRLSDEFSTLYNSAL
jgi:hypothetical protein